MFSKDLNEKLDEFHLLKHPFYIAWNKGELSLEIIRDYAEQYYHHVKAFPRYISATHSLCEDISKRKVLLENLQDEEKDGADHPFLNSFKLCALTGMTVNYTNAGTYTTYEDGTPVNIRMNLTFKELNPIYHEDYATEGAGPGVGY